MLIVVDNIKRFPAIGNYNYWAMIIYLYILKVLQILVFHKLIKTMRRILLYRLCDDISGKHRAVSDSTSACVKMAEYSSGVYPSLDHIRRNFDFILRGMEITQLTMDWYCYILCTEFTFIVRLGNIKVTSL